MNSTHPAATAALTAMSAVSAGDRAAWLACFADDATLHDPVGGSPLDPAGTGLRGQAALQLFWDLAIAPNGVRFDVAAMHPAGDEVAVVASVTIRAPGDRTAVEYDGVFIYRAGADGRIASMRGYWDVHRALADRGA